MEFTNKQDKQIFILGNSTYCILLFFAAFFYQERMLFIDMAYHAYSILTTENFAIQNNRFGACFTQIIPFLAVKAGCSLKAFLILYSFSFILFYYALFFLCIKWLKQPKFALVLLLHAVLMTTDTFYWIQSELQQGIPFLLFCFALFFHKASLKEYSILKKIIFICSIAILPFFHPLLPVVFVFCILVFKFSGFPFESQKTKLIFSVFLLAIVIKTLLFPSNSYDSAAFAKLKNIVQLFPNYWNLPSNKNFLRWCFFDYNLLIGLFCFCCIIFYRNKNYRLLLLQACCFTGYVFVVNICYPENVPQFYMENLYLPISIMVIVPFIFNAAKDILYTNFKNILVLLLSLRLFFIFLNHTKFSNRIQWEKDVLSKSAQLYSKKWILAEAAIPTNITIMNWGLVYEFLLLSSLENNKESRSILVVENPNDYKWALPGNNHFITNWSVLHYNNAPKKYFHFTDTTQYIIREKL